MIILGLRPLTLLFALLPHSEFQNLQIIGSALASSEVRPPRPPAEPICNSCNCYSWLPYRVRKRRWADCIVIPRHLGHASPPRTPEAPLPQMVPTVHIVWLSQIARRALRALFFFACANLDGSMVPTKAEAVSNTSEENDTCAHSFLPRPPFPCAPHPHTSCFRLPPTALLLLLFFYFFVLLAPAPHLSATPFS